MRYTALFLVMACGSNAGEQANEPAPEMSFSAQLVVHNRSLDNVIVRVCEAGVCRRVVGFVGARNDGRDTFTYASDANLEIEVQYVGRDPGVWRSESLYWAAPGICIELDVHPYDMQRHNSLKRCTTSGDP